MERRIAEAQEQYHKLKQECEVTINFLNTLVESYAEGVEMLDNFTSDEHRLKMKYFLMLSQFQHVAHQKILELNVDLEEFVLDNQIMEFEHFKQTCISPQARSSVSECTSKSPTLNLQKPMIDRLSSYTSGAEKLHLNGVGTEPHCELQSCYKETKKEFDTSTLNDTSSTSKSDVFYDLNDSLNGSGDAHEFNKKMESSNSRTATPLEDFLEIKRTPAIVETKSQQQSQQVASCISDTLKSLPSMLSVQKKFMQKPQTSTMPDISLRATHTTYFDIVDEKYDNVFEANPVIEEKQPMKRKCKVKLEQTVDKAVQKHAILEIEKRHPPLVGDICMVGSADSPSQFYIQVCDEDSDQLDVMAEQLAEIHSNTTLLVETKVDAMNQLGRFCSVAVKDVWYRAEITNWLQNSYTDKVQVQLIDYGLKYSVSYKELRPLPSYCQGYRRAQKCCLAYLYPPGSTRMAKLKEWPETSMEAFLNYCCDSDTSIFRITYIQQSSDRDVLEIDLVRIDDDNSDDKSVGDILLETALAVQIIDSLNGIVKNPEISQQILAAHGVAGIKSGMTQEEIFDIYFDEVDKEPNNINEAVMNYDPKDESQTCRNLRPDGTCYKGSKCKWRHEVLRSGFTNDKEAVYWKAFSDLSLPSAGDDVFLTISHVVDIQWFYAQIRSAGTGINFSINDLITTMNESHTIKMYKKIDEVPSAGQMVIAKYWNNYWYRGQIRDVSYFGYKIAQAEVYFVDFGDVLPVSVDELRLIVPEFLELPFQAIECKMYNLKPKDDLDKSFTRNKFETKVLGYTLKAHVVATPGHLEVLLENKDGDDIGLQLIEEGHGELNTEHNFPRADELILID